MARRMCSAYDNPVFSDSALRALGRGWLRRVLGRAKPPKTLE